MGKYKRKRKEEIFTLEERAFKFSLREGCYFKAKSEEVTGQS